MAPGETQAPLNDKRGSGLAANLLGEKYEEQKTQDSEIRKVYQQQNKHQEDSRLAVVPGMGSFLADAICHSERAAGAP